jgi:hypothetical protein
MKNGRYLPWALALSLVIPLAAVVPAQASQDWDQITSERAPVGSEAVSVDEYGAFESRSMRQVVTNARSSGVFTSWLCEDGNTGSGDCDLSDPEKRFDANAILPFCEGTFQENCVEGLALAGPGGSFVPANFIRHVNTKTLPEIKSQGLMAGGATSLFESSILHEGGSGNYAATVVAQIEYDRFRKVFIARSINVGVYGYNEMKDPSIREVNLVDSVNSAGRRQVSMTGSAPMGCKWAENGACGKVAEFAPGVRIKLTIRVPDSITGWFRGRLTKPEVSVNRFSSRNSRIEIAAAPVEVARFHAVASLSNTTAAQQKEIREHGGSARQFQGGGRVYPFAHWGSFYWIEMFRELAKDTAVTTTSHWSFSTIDNASGNPCLASQSKLLGIVTTNATMYNGIVPAFSNGQLNYEVSGMHYLPGGALSLGTYDLVMRSEVARCLYGFSKAPLNAKVSVVNDKGERSTATTVVGEKNGWLRLAAYGFTFSQKTIKVKITQKKKR